MKYQISNIISKEWNGRKFQEAELTFPDGSVNKVSDWNELWKGEGEWEGEVDKNEKGFYRTKAPVRNKPSTFGMMKKEEMIINAQERKAEFIKDAQERKEESIAYFNSLNSAISFVQKYGPHPEITTMSEALDLVKNYTKEFYKTWESWKNEAFH